MAEGEGFEPPVPTRSTTDFESAAFVHSATPPVEKRITRYRKNAVNSILIYL